MRAGTMEILVILAVVLIIFGPKQIPKLAKMFGKTTKAFKDGMDDEEEAPAEKNEDKAAPVEEKAEEKKTEDKTE